MPIPHFLVTIPSEFESADHVWFPVSIPVDNHAPTPPLPRRGGLLSAQAAPSDSAVRAIIKERVDAGRFAGIAVGFVSRDNQRRVIAYGLSAGVQPFDGNTVFEIGSITKTFTAAILADMVKKGEVALDDPVAKYLPPGTVIPERDGKQITLLDLATQSSGLPGMPDNFKPKDTANPYADYTSRRCTSSSAATSLRAASARSTSTPTSASGCSARR